MKKIIKSDDKTVYSLLLYLHMVALMKQAIIVFTESIISRSAAVPLPHMKNPTINALMSKTR
ncbi:hypothetical protein, partial [Ruminococcus sp.]|uniref:hypothetical protein n=1 Tax=Ruminococcus sp. TaxID=41978 RepID=UPI0025F8A87E